MKGPLFQYLTNSNKYSKSASKVLIDPDLTLTDSIPIQSDILWTNSFWSVYSTTKSSSTFYNLWRTRSFWARNKCSFSSTIHQ